MSTETDVKIRILLAAKKLFARQGFEKTTVRQICEEASANVALVSYYFGGKENMFAALFENFLPNEEIAKINPGLDPVSGLKLIIRGVTELRSKDHELVSIIQQEIVMNTERVIKIRQHVMPLWAMCKRWLIQGKEQGLFSFASIDVALMSVIGTILYQRHSPYWQLLMEEENLDIELMIEELTSFILGGLQARV
jgi:AcrR family transcriptional regulator